MRAETGKLSEAIEAFALPGVAAPLAHNVAEPRPVRTAPALPPALVRKTGKEVEWDEF